MSRNIHLSDELYIRLEQQAAQQGQTIEDYLDQLTACGMAKSGVGPPGTGERETRERDMVRNQLLSRGLLVTFPDSVPGARAEVTEHPPITVTGAPVSQTIIEDRR